ncbi:hypothetical protein AB0H73_39165 [Streptomyces olivoreticuli]
MRALAPGGWTHLRIARTLDTAGRPAQALQWAERGLHEAVGEQHVHDELVDYVARRYTDTGRQTDTVALRRDRFRAELTLAAYRKLRTAASHAGCWDSDEGERATALGLLRAAAAARRRTADPQPACSRQAAHDALHMPRQGHALIDVLIDENARRGMGGRRRPGCRAPVARPRRRLHGHTPRRRRTRLPARGHRAQTSHG